MSFDATWLDLRAPADAAARDATLLTKAAAVLARRPVAVDLGAGTGATMRAFEAAGPANLRWTLVDNDPALLAVARARHGSAAEAVRADLRDIAALPIDGAGLVTASALFDLMPQRWIGALADRLADLGIGIYAALSYDGVMRWSPPFPDDDAVAAAFNAHQQRDKGMGPALGPAAAAVLADAMRARGYIVEVAASAWRLGPPDAALQNALVDGIAAAATEMGLAGAEAWAQARRAASGSTFCTVGHSDVLALPCSAASAQSNTTSESSP